MRKFFLIIILFVLTIGGNAQSRALQRADALYEKFDYSRALNRYLKLEQGDEARYYVTRRIADCYRHLNMPVYATDWYLKAIEFPDVDAETYYHLGKSLRILKRYEESNTYLAQFHMLNRTQMPMRGLTPEEYLLSIHSDSGRAEIFLLSINSNFSEFGPAIWNNFLVFSSNRPGKTVIRYRDTRNNLPFFDIYAAPILDFAKLGRPEYFTPHLKSKFNDGPVSFSADGLQMYITRNTTPNPLGESELDILIARHNEGKWEKVLATLPLKLKGYSIAHPAISSDGQRLYFASDMPGGYGGMDLYYSERRGGFLSQPVNLGPDINTPGNEVFPYIDKDGRLFFSSDGLPGLGGLDIFIAVPAGEGFSKPHNVGPGINSPYDDFTIVFNEDNESGYFASNRPDINETNSDNIYAFRLLQPLRFSAIEGKIVNTSTGNKEAEVQISIAKFDGTPIASLESDEDGSFVIHLLRDQSYKLVFRKRFMDPVEKTLTFSDMDGFSTINMQIEISPR